MKAAALVGTRYMAVQEMPDPEVQPNGIVIKVRACRICGSDLHIYKRGMMSGAQILGHEFSGDVVKVGANVVGIKEGDRVTALSGGAYAEYVSVPMAMLDMTVYRLPDDMSYEVGATIEPVTLGVHAATRAQPKPEDTVVVIGAGMIGQSTLQAFKAMGVSRVIVSEMGKKRMEVARAMGADVVINAAEEDAVSRVFELTGGVGAEIVCECAGSPATYQQALDMVRSGGMMQADMLRPGGKVILEAVYEQPIQWEPVYAITKGIEMIHCFGGCFPTTIDLMKTGKINSLPLITHEFPLDKIQEAFKTQMNPDETIKVIIKP